MKPFIIIITFLLFDLLGFAQSVKPQIELCQKGVLSQKNSIKKLSIIIDSDTLYPSHVDKNIFTFSSLVPDTSFLVNRNLNDKRVVNQSDYIDTIFISKNCDSISLLYETRKYTYAIPIKKWEILCGLYVCIDKIDKSHGLFTYSKRNCTSISHIGILKRTKRKALK